MLALLLLCACGGTPTTSEQIAAQVNAAREPAEARTGNLLLRAGIAPTAVLDGSIVARYGVEPGPRTVLLLVSMHRVDGHVETAVPATLTAGVRDLRGARSTVALREIRNEGHVEYAGEMHVTPPDTLTFDISADAGDGRTVELDFSREVFLPRHN